MPKFVSARQLAIKADQTVQIAHDERVMSAEYNSPYFYLIIVKELYKSPEFGVPELRGNLSDE